MPENQLYIWIMDCSWRGCIVVVAKDRESAIAKMKEQYNFSTGEITRHDIIDGFTYVNLGDA